jgi:hypothetical protein
MVWPAKVEKLRPSQDSPLKGLNLAWVPVGYALFFPFCSISCTGWVVVVLRLIHGSPMRILVVVGTNLGIS